MSNTKSFDQATVNIINGETIIHIPRHIVEQFGSLGDGEKLSVSIQKGEIVILKK